MSKYVKADVVKNTRRRRTRVAAVNSKLGSRSVGKQHFWSKHETNFMLEEIKDVNINNKKF